MFYLARLVTSSSIPTEVALKHTATGRVYWAIQAGLLTPLTFARHRLSPLAAFTSGAYFLHNERRWQWICEFYTANLKGIFGGPYSECVWQQAITYCLCYRMLQNAFFPWTRDLLVSQKTTQRHFFSTLHPLCTVIFATATVLAFVVLHNSRFNFHCYTQREATPTQKPARKCTATSRGILCKRLQSAFTLANQLCWITQ